VNLAGQAVGRLVRADLPLVLVDLAADLLDLDRMIQKAGLSQ